MGRQKRKVDATPMEDWADAWWDWAAELNTGRDCAVQISMNPHKQHGAWNISARALQKGADGKWVVVNSETMVWPNAEVITFGGAVTRLIVRLTQGADQDTQASARQM